MLCDGQCNFKVIEGLKPSGRFYSSRFAVLIPSILACWQTEQTEQTYPPSVDFYLNRLGEKILNILETGVDGVIGGCARG